MKYLARQISYSNPVNGAIEMLKKVDTGPASRRAQRIRREKKQQIAAAQNPDTLDLKNLQLLQGSRLRKAREAAGLSQTAAANKVRKMLGGGMKYASSLGNIETGRNSTDFKTILAFAELYGVPVSFLMGAENQMGLSDMERKLFRGYFNAPLAVRNMVDVALGLKEIV